MMTTPNTVVGVADPPRAPTLCMLLKDGSLLVMAECMLNNQPRMVSPIVKLADVPFVGERRHATTMRALALVAMGRYVVMAMDAGVLAVIRWAPDWQTYEAHLLPAGYSTPETVSTLAPAMCVVHNGTGGPGILCCGGGAPAMFERMASVKYAQMSDPSARAPYTTLVPLVSPTPEKSVQPFKCCRMSASRHWVALVLDRNSAAITQPRDGTDGVFSYKHATSASFLPTTMVMAYNENTKAWSNWCPPKDVPAKVIHTAWKHDADMLVVICGATITLLTPATTANPKHGSSMKKMVMTHSMPSAVDLPVYAFHQGPRANTLVTCSGCIVSQWAAEHEVMAEAHSEDDSDSDDDDHPHRMPTRVCCEVDVDPLSQCMLMDMTSAASACVCPASQHAEGEARDFVAAMMDTGVLEVCAIRLPGGGETAATKSEFSVDRIPECDAANCSICMTPVDEVAQICVLDPCTHMFHRDCINEWKARSGICPECRTDVGRYQNAMDVFGGSELAPMAKEPSAFQREQHGVLARYYAVLSSG